MKPDFTKWTTEDLTWLMENSGYGADDVISAYYRRTTDTGKAVFNIDYENLDGDIESGQVYVFIRNGKLQAEF